MEEKKTTEEQYNGMTHRRGLWRTDRPLPPRGCSRAYYTLLFLLAAFLIFMYIRYRHV